MRFGCCFSLLDDDILLLPQAGAEYVETAFSDLEALTPQQCWERSRILAASGVSVKVMNVMFPGSLRLTGEQVDYDKIDRYLEQGLEKAKLFGVEKVVFGSGAARMVPTGFSHEEAFSQLIRLCRSHIAPAFRQRDMICCIEPLNRGECNIINSCAQGFRLAEAVGEPSIRLLVDLYHFDLEKEPLASLTEYGNYLAHAHIASAKNNRLIPQDGDGEDYPTFFRALQSAGYTGEISLEGHMSGGIRQIAASLAYLKSLDH